MNELGKTGGAKEFFNRGWDRDVLNAALRMQNASRSRGTSLRSGEWGRFKRQGREDRQDWDQGEVQPRMDTNWLPQARLQAGAHSRRSLREMRSRGFFLTEGKEGNEEGSE